MQILPKLHNLITHCNNKTKAEKHIIFQYLHVDIFILSYYYLLYNTLWTICILRFRIFWQTITIKNCRPIGRQNIGYMLFEISVMYFFDLSGLRRFWLNHSEQRKSIKYSFGTIYPIRQSRYWSRPLFIQPFTAFFVKPVNILIWSTVISSR